MRPHQLTIIQLHPVVTLPLSPRAAIVVQLGPEAPFNAWGRIRTGLHFQDQAHTLQAVPQNGTAPDNSLKPNPARMITPRLHNHSKFIRLPLTRVLHKLAVLAAALPAGQLVAVDVLQHLRRKNSWHEVWVAHDSNALRRGDSNKIQCCKACCGTTVGARPAQPGCFAQLAARSPWHAGWLLSCKPPGPLAGSTHPARVAQPRVKGGCEVGEEPQAVAHGHACGAGPVRLGGSGGS